MEEMTDAIWRSTLHQAILAPYCREDSRERRALELRVRRKVQVPKGEPPSEAPQGELWEEDWEDILRMGDPQQEDEALERDVEMEDELMGAWGGLDDEIGEAIKKEGAALSPVVAQEEEGQRGREESCHGGHQFIERVAGNRRSTGLSAHALPSCALRLHPVVVDRNFARPPWRAGSPRACETPAASFGRRGAPPPSLSR
mgnify:CR=1 FL=1